MFSQTIHKRRPSRNVNGSVNCVGLWFDLCLQKFRRSRFEYKHLFRFILFRLFSIRFVSYVFMRFAYLLNTALDYRPLLFGAFTKASLVFNIQSILYSLVSDLLNQHKFGVHFDFVSRLTNTWIESF